MLTSYQTYTLLELINGVNEFVRDVASSLCREVTPEEAVYE